MKVTMLHQSVSIEFSTEGTIFPTRKNKGPLQQNITLYTACDFP